MGITRHDVAKVRRLARVDTAPFLIRAGSRSPVSQTRILAAGIILAAVTLVSLLCGTQAVLAQATRYYTIDLATARSRASAAEWLQRYEAARQARPDFAVETIDDFIKMNEYYDKFLADGVAVHSFRTAHGDDIRCIDVATQRSALDAGLDRANIPRRATVEPTQQTQAGQPQSPGPPPNQGLDGSLDGLGRERSCPEGSFPKLIFPKTNLYRFKKFEDIFRKHSNAQPDAISPPAANSPHEYAHGSNLSTDNKGLSGIFNVWSPTIQVPTSDEMSLA